MESGIALVDVDDSSVQRKLAAILDNLAPERTEGLLRAIGYAMRASTMKKFGEERGPEGKWQPLQSETIRRRRTRRDRPVKTTKILQDSSQLKSTIHSVAEAASVDIGSSLVYGPFHQLGAPRAGIPARPFLYVDDADSARIEQLALNYLARFVS